MIFTDAAYWLVLFGAVASFHMLPLPYRKGAILFWGSLFLANWGGALVLALFLYETIFSRLYRKFSFWCIVGIAQAALILLYFKYRFFFMGIVDTVLGIPVIPTDSPLLPLGISFFTFEFIHYAADIRAGKYEPGKLRDYAAFILFFPTMVAGPIKRFNDFHPKLNAARWDRETALEGLSRIAVGYFRKVVIADTVARLVLSSERFTDAGSAAQVVSMLAYSVQIYNDFAGYSDIAIGSALLFGIRVPENFLQPYRALNIADFWKRWHVSLYRWIVDYIFIPLGGSRRGLALTLVNTVIALLISGLWHGAAWHFVAWGLYHGLLLAGYRLFRTACPEGIPYIPVVLRNACSWGLTFGLVTVGWVLFLYPLDVAAVILGITPVR